MVKCSGCGSDNPEGNKFCSNCSQALGEATVRCPHCGTNVLAGNRVCTQCGKSLSAASAPPTQPTYSYASSPAPQTAKKSPLVAILVVVGLMILVCCGGGIGLISYRESHSGIFVDGKEISRSEAKTGIREMNAINVAMENPSTKVGDLVATSPFSQKFKGIIVALQKDEATLDVDLKGTNVDKIVSAQLGTEAGRVTSRKDLETVDKAFARYFDAIRDRLHDLDTFVNNMTGPGGKPIPMSLSSLVAPMQTTYNEYTAIRKQLVDLADRDKPLPSGEHILFQTDDHLKQFNKLVVEHDDRYNKFKQSIEEYRRQVEAQVRTALDSMKTTD